jgi:hypothetical protein
MRLDLNAPVTLEGIGSVVGSFLGWWQAQLLGLLPEHLRSALQSALEPRRVAFEGEVLHLKPARPNSSELTIAPGKPDAARAQISREAPELRTRRVDVELEPREVLVRQISLPRAARSRLTSAIKLQLDRLSPFHGEDVQFAFHEREATADEIALEVAMVPKAMLFRHEEKLNELGLAVHRFRVANSQLQISPVRKNWTNQEKLQFALGGAALMCWLAAIAVAPAMREAELNRLETQVASIQPVGEKAATLKSEVEKARLSATLADELLSTQPPLLVLDGLTQSVPDDTQILELTTDGSRLELEGVATKASWTMASLGKSKQFPLVRLVPPVSHLGPNLERFRLEGQLAVAQSIQGGTQ